MQDNDTQKNGNLTEPSFHTENKKTEEVQLGSGQILAKSRKEQGLSIQDISSKLNLSESQIMTIELDQTEGLPEMTYVRGYIRSYANLLGLDPDEVIKRYKYSDKVFRSQLNHFPRQLGESKGGKKNRLVLFFFLIALCGLAYYLYDTFYQQKSTSSSSYQIEASKTPSSDNTLEVKQNTNVAEKKQTAIEQESKADTVTENKLVLRFQNTTWVDASDTDGNKLAFKSYSQGEELLLKSQGLIKVFVGNAEGLTAEFNGKMLDLSQYQKEGSVFVRFVVGQ